MMAFAPTSNAEDWRETVEVTDENGAAFDLTGYTIELELVDMKGWQQLLGGTQTGHITIAAPGFSFVFPASQMRELPAATYSVNCRMTAPDGAIIQPFSSHIAISEGGFR